MASALFLCALSPETMRHITSLDTHRGTHDYRQNTQNLGLARRQDHRAGEGRRRRLITHRAGAGRDPCLADPTFAALARECLRRAQSPHDEPDDIAREQPATFTVWGENLIEPQAVAQMENAMRLPVAVMGALMPDAHVGYGLPVGGVLA